MRETIGRTTQRHRRRALIGKPFHSHRNRRILCVILAPPGRNAGRRRFWSLAMADTILMPKATAVWLVDNTSLTFEQIADFCGLHPLEVKGIADEDVAKGIKGQDPVASGQLTREQIAEAEKDPAYRMKAQKSRHAELLKPVKKGPRYTP